MPHRQLRKKVWLLRELANSSLPHRQLRNQMKEPAGAGSGSLPHRQPGLPSVAQQYIAYGRAQAVIDIVMPVLGLLLAAWLIKHERMHFGAPLDIKSKGALISVLINTVAAGLGTYSVIMFVHATHAAALVWSAPKVWLLRELANIIK